MKPYAFDAFEPARAVLRDPHTTYSEIGPAIEMLAESNAPGDIRAVSMFRNLGWSDRDSDLDVSRARATLSVDGYAPAVDKITAAKPRPNPPASKIDLARIAIWAILFGLVILCALVVLLLAADAIHRLNIGLDEVLTQAETMRGM